MITLTENAKEYLKGIANDDHVTLGVKVVGVVVLLMYGIIRRTGLMSNGVNQLTIY